MAVLATLLRLVAPATFGVPCVFTQTPTELLDQADHLADSFDLSKAQPLYIQAEAVSRVAGDSKDELRAKLGQLRYRVQLGYYTVTREELRRILSTALVENDLHLKIRALEVLGSIDLNQDVRSASLDWTQLLSAAQTVNDANWINRAKGFLGIVSGLNGDIGARAAACSKHWQLRRKLATSQAS